MKPAVSIAHPKAHNANAVNSCKRFIVFSTDFISHRSHRLRKYFFVLPTNAASCIYMGKGKKSFSIFLYFCRHKVPYFCFSQNKF